VHQEASRAFGGKNNITLLSAFSWSAIQLCWCAVKNLFTHIFNDLELILVSSTFQRRISQGGVFYFAQLQ